MSKAMTAASKEQLMELMQYLSQNISVPTIGIGGGFAPIGTIISYMGTTAPQDYLICDGTTYNIADYKQLSDFFAAQFGSANFFGGDGVTTFKVPDLRGEFLRGTGTNSHTNQGNGANVGTHQDGTEIGETYSNMTDKRISVSGYKPKNFDKRIKQSNDEAGRLLVNTNDTDEWGYYYTARPTNTSVLYCIKAVAAGDVYSTTERVVGTWIDGKPVYEKTIVDTMPSEVDTDKLINVGASVDAFVYDKCYLINNGSYSPLNIVIENGASARYFLRDDASSTPNKIGFHTSHDGWTNKPVQITIRYTKTTD